LVNYYQNYHGLDTNDTDQFKQNSLHIACGSQHTNLATYLIKSKKMNLYDQDFNGNTCLHMAAKSGLSRICWLIVKQSGKRIMAVKNNANLTALDMLGSDKT
jgi:ankyrin repeat protein